MDWIRRFILFNAKRHPAQMGKPEVTAFLTYLAARRNVAASTQNQALSAILFLYREVLEEVNDIKCFLTIRFPEIDPSKR